MRRTSFVLLSAFVAVAACSSANNKRPADLGSCLPSEGMVCASPSSGSTSGAGDQSTDAAAADNADSTPVGCGGAELLVPSQNIYCAQCIVANCCQADQLCTGSCAQLLECTIPCAQGDTTCVGNCENNLPAAFTAYQGFVQCVNANCASPLCPNLQD